MHRRVTRLARGEISQVPESTETLGGGGGCGETWLGGSQAKSRVASELDGSADLKTLN